MKKRIILLIVCINTFSLPIVAHELLTGSTISHSWTENTFPKTWSTPKFQTFICDDKTLIWNNITDMTHLTSGVEEYTVVELAPKLLQVSWKESPETTNYGIVWTLDFNQMIIRGVLVNIDSKVNFVVSGKFSKQYTTKPKSHFKSCR